MITFLGYHNFCLKFTALATIVCSAFEMSKNAVVDKTKSTAFKRSTMEFFNWENPMNQNPKE